VRAVLRSRLDAIDETGSQVLAAAAIIGRTFDIATVRHASGRSEEETVDALDRLSARAIVRDGPAGYDFTHGALRDLVDEGIGLARRRLLHQRVAEALHLGRWTGIAIHERDAGRTEAAAEAYREAATRAAQVFANQAVIEHAGAALALGHPDGLALHTLIGRARTRLGDYDGAVAAFEAAAARASEAELPGIELAIGRARLRRGDLAGADRHLATVADDAAAPPAVAARAWVDRSVIRRRAGDVAAASDAARRALAIAVQAGDDPAIGAARRMLGLSALDAGDAVTARTELTRALDAAEADPDPTSRIAALVGLAMAAGTAGETDAAIAHGRRALDACRRIGDRHLEAAVEDHIADLLHAAGRDDDAREHQRRAAAAFAELGGDPADPDPGIWMLAAW
jgi:tetratricopeptide (TPR) repeat protein